MRNIIILLVFCLIVSGCVSTPPRGKTELSNLRKSIVGPWAWNSENCEKSPQIYSFSEDGSKMYVDSGEGLNLGNRNKKLYRVIYNILDEQVNVLRTSIEGEDRFLDISTKVKWDLVLKSNNQFCWHRTDWAPQACTKPVHKCGNNS